MRIWSVIRLKPRYRLLTVLFIFAAIAGQDQSLGLCSLTSKKNQQRIESNQKQTETAQVVAAFQTHGKLLLNLFFRKHHSFILYFFLLLSHSA